MFVDTASINMPAGRQVVPEYLSELDWLPHWQLASDA